MILLRTRTKALWIWENKFLLQDSTNESYRCLKSWLPNLTGKSLVKLLMCRCVPDSGKVLSKPMMAMGLGRKLVDS